MDCHFCGEKLIEGYLNCPGCRHPAFDIDYLENMDKMEKKYSKTGLLELSEEKFTPSSKGQTIIAVRNRYLMNIVKTEHFQICAKDWMK